MVSVHITSLSHLGLSNVIFKNSLPAADRIDLKGTIFLSSVAAKWQYRSDNHMLQQGLILELGVSDDF
ncbi:hypothetical protein V6N13_026242 [Hibiscus sabdariffa]